MLDLEEDNILDKETDKCMDRRMDRKAFIETKSATLPKKFADHGRNNLSVYVYHVSQYHVYYVFY